jgi:hypothetical protein
VNGLYPGGCCRRLRPWLWWWSSSSWSSSLITNERESIAETDTNTCRNKWHVHFRNYYT